jgi:carbon-monoxide dehydrogenase large subunit
LTGRVVGRSVTRVEDPRLLRGGGRYLADTIPADALHAVFVRSPLPHALVGDIRIDAALRVPGVHAVLTAADLEHAPLVDLLPIEGLRRTPQTALAGERVRFAGEAVAVVLASGRYEAEDGAELVEVDFEPLPTVADVESSLADGAPLLFPDLGTNAVYRGSRTCGDVEAAFAAASHVVEHVFHHNRYLAAPLETRGCAAAFDPSAGELTVWSSTQSPHLLRRRLALATGIGEGAIRILVPDVGGGFGQKIPIHPEEVAVALAARLVGRTVAWIEDRRENLVAAPHAKEQTIASELALDTDGTFLAFRARFVGDAGAYSFNNASALIEPYLAASLLPGVYRVPAVAYEVVAALTNKAPVAPYRGIGWTAGHCARELLIEHAARELGLDPASLRRRNMVEAHEFPYESCTGMLYDSGSFRESLDRALELIGYEDLRARQERGRDAGRYVGVGLSPYVEPTGWGTEGSAQASWVLVSHDSARVTIEPSGEIVVAVGTPSQGQGHATAFAQLAAETLGCSIEDVRVRANDTSSVPISVAGTRASRTAVVVGGAVLRAASELRERVLEIAGQLLEADPADLDVVDGGVAIRDAPSRRVTLREVAEAAYFRPTLRVSIPEPSLSVESFHDPRATYSNGCIACVVEVDAETGAVDVVRVVAVEDCGTIVNPAIVEGQIRGAVAQGIGGALLEHAVYDDEGQPQASTFVDYLLPTAAEVPEIEIEHLSSPSPFTPGGIKGMGESGLVATPAAVALAVEDALAPFAARVDRLPLTPELVAGMIPERTSTS